MLEHASVLIFCIEYALRIWTADYLYPEKRRDAPGSAFSFPLMEWWIC